MGADLILVALPISEQTIGSIAGLREKISEIDFEDAGHFHWAESCGVDCDEGDYEEARDFLNDAVTDLVIPLMSGKPLPRDVVTMTLGGSEYMFSGGMSWGDNPTESFDQILALAESGIMD